MIYKENDKFGEINGQELTKEELRKVFSWFSTEEEIDQYIKSKETNK